MIDLGTFELPSQFTSFQPSLPFQTNSLAKYMLQHASPTAVAPAFPCVGLSWARTTHTTRHLYGTDNVDASVTVLPINLIERVEQHCLPRNCGVGDMHSIR